MRPFFLVVLVTVTISAQDRQIKGNVTYLSGSTVYTSIGSNQGVVDSTALYIVAGTDTIAQLKVFAVSSKSSACSVIRQKREIAVGDAVTGMRSVDAGMKESVVTVSTKDSAGIEEPVRSVAPIRRERAEQRTSVLSVQGRVSLQYYAATFENNAFDFKQPGVVLNLHASSPEVPVRLNIYGNLRTLSRGTTSPFSADAVDASRVYRFSLEYDDRQNSVAVGRIIPPYAPSIGSIDGVSYSRHFGPLVAGASIGFQPPYTLQGLSTDTRKAALFVQYETRWPMDLTVTTAYARTYFQSILDREAVSFMVNGYSGGGISIYGYGDVDLRTKEGDQFRLSPSCSIASVNVSWSVTNFLSLGVGADASRAVFPYSSVRFVADTLLDRTLRSGASFNVNVNLPYGFGAFNTYSPRSTDAGFGQEYMNNSSFYLMNALSTGATIRATYTMNENQFTSSRGYGLNLQRDLFGIDVAVRYQQNRYRIRQLGQDNVGETLGADVMALVTKSLSFMLSLDSLHGYGVNSYTLFTELSWRM